MSDLDFTICCIVTFFSKKRRTSPNVNNEMYYPHFVIKGTEEYLDINFIDGEDVIFDKSIQANALPVYETIDYSAIQAGAEFLIMEGGNIVGEGIVKAIFHHQPYDQIQINVTYYVPQEKLILSFLNDYIQLPVQ